MLLRQEGKRENLSFLIKDLWMTHKERKVHWRTTVGEEGYRLMTKG